MNIPIHVRTIRVEAGVTEEARRPTLVSACKEGEAIPLPARRRYPTSTP